MYHIRLAWLMIAQLFGTRRRDPMRSVVRRFWVTPFDVELTMASSYSYFSFAALGRWAFFLDNGDLRGIFREGWAPMTHSEIIRFQKAASIFSPVTVATKVIWWDEKMMYLEHRMSVRGDLCAVGFSRGAFYKKRERVPPYICAPGLPEIPPFAKPEVVGFLQRSDAHFAAREPDFSDADAELSAETTG